jgi:SanA protein
MRAAAELYRSSKVDGILVSGDNGSEEYNEPEQMKADLVALGVPAEHITADYAGFRTLDSIYRAGDVFGLRSYIVVTQAFHLPRALYLADQKGHDAVGYVAYGPGGYWGQRVRAREILARAQAVLDVEILRRGPRFLGEPVQVSRR